MEIMDPDRGKSSSNNSNQSSTNQSNNDDNDNNNDNNDNNDNDDETIEVLIDELSSLSLAFVDDIYSNTQQWYAYVLAIDISYDLLYIGSIALQLETSYTYR